MQLPQILKILIDRDHQISGIVYGAIGRFTPWIVNSQMPLFPEYTDHSLKHVEEVMQTAVDLATEDACKILSSSDAAVLVLGICLHDCAMHLTEDGFFSLVRPNCPWRPVSEFDTISWDVLWDQFLSEAKRFDGRKLTSLFGDAEPIRQPPEQVASLSKRDRLLMGEFIRRNHARLAHEIALFGIPGVDGNPSLLIGNDSDLGKWLSDIAGAVARSHGISLRDATAFMDKKYHKRDFNSVHAVFLMSLLRIADYLQIQAKRAPKEVLEVRRLTSPVSQGEWKVHAAVRNITAAGDDPEAIVVDAYPLEIATFLRLKEWLAGIQDELDISWAVLGEVYGRYSQEGLDKLKLKLRRLHSNLDDIVKFSKTVPYVPARAAFEAANPDLLKLLVGPLYNDDPSIGLRELIQNSVDAVRECHEMRTRRPDLRNVELRQLDSDIEIRVECDNNWMPTALTISDRGIGMNEDIVQNYFLKAGASFRKSDAWRKNFEDHEGHATVLRSGRFGIGALAAFLLGDVVQVTTRHLESPSNRGIRFSANLDDSALSLDWIDAPVGTEMVIQISPARQQRVHSAMDFFNWRSGRTKVEFDSGLGWYYSHTPTISRKVVRQGNQVIPLTIQTFVPSEDDGPKSHWRAFKTADYQSVFWTYANSDWEASTFDPYPALLCNGIVVMAPRPPHQGNLELIGDPNLSTPRLVIYDRDGHLPLNLQRTGLAGADPSLSEGLLSSVVDDIIAYALTQGVHHKKWAESEHTFLRGEYPGFSSHYYDRFVYHRWFLSRDGFGLLDRSLALEGDADALLFIFVSERTAENECGVIASVVRDLLPDHKNALIYPSVADSQINNEKFIVRSLMRWEGPVLRWLPGVLQVGEGEPLKFVGRQVAVRKAIVDRLDRHPKTGEELKALTRESLQAGTRRDKWLIRKLGTCYPQDSSPFENLLDALSMESVLGVAWCNLHANQMVVPSDLSRLWLDRLGTALIPYDPKKRKVQFVDATKALSHYASAWRNDVRYAKKTAERTLEDGEN